MKNRPRTSIALFVAGIAVCAGGPARAGEFQVSPVLVSLGEEKKSGVIEVSNRSDEPIRLQVKAHAWDQSASGAMVLAPTQDIVVFPTMIALKPGETRNVRVGTRLAARGVERSFRVFVEELPPLPGARRGGGIQVLMRMGIPVFVGGENEAPDARVETASASKDGRFSFVVRNKGRAHAVTRGVEATLIDARGDVVAVHSFAGWYLLAGGERVYERPIGSAAACAATRVQVRIDTDRGASTSSAPLAATRCGR